MSLTMARHGLYSTRSIYGRINSGFLGDSLPYFHRIMSKQNIEIHSRVRIYPSTRWYTRFTPNFRGQFSFSGLAHFQIFFQASRTASKNFKRFLVPFCAMACLRGKISPCLPFFLQLTDRKINEETPGGNISHNVRASQQFRHHSPPPIVYRNGWLENIRNVRFF